MPSKAARHHSDRVVYSAMQIHESNHHPFMLHLPPDPLRIAKKWTGMRTNIPSPTGIMHLE